MIGRKDILDALEEALRLRGEVAVPAAGVSMGGVFGDAEALVVRPPGPRPIRRGEVVVIRRAETWMVHRVVLCWGRRYVTKGDAVATIDRPFASKAGIVGRVVAVRTRAGDVDLCTPAARKTGRAIAWKSLAAGLRAAAAGIRRPTGR